LAKTKEGDPKLGPGTRVVPFVEEVGDSVRCPVEVVEVVEVSLEVGRWTEETH
jgi:hypothetical protein